MILDFKIYWCCSIWTWCEMFFVLLQQLYILIIYYLFIFLCVFIFVHMEQIRKSALSFHHGSPRDWTQVTRLVSQAFSDWAIPLNPAIHLKDSFVHSFVTRWPVIIKSFEIFDAKKINEDTDKDSALKDSLNAMLLLVCLTVREHFAVKLGCLR